MYVWAIEQDELSKRKVVSEDETPSSTGKDVIVPWVLSKDLQVASKPSGSPPPNKGEPQVYHRYYHMFAKGELRSLVEEAASELGLQLGPRSGGEGQSLKGLEIIQDGWERSNYYVEFRLWQT